MKRLPTSQLSRVVLMVCMLYMAMSTTRVLQVLPFDYWDNKELVFPSVVHLDGEGVYYGNSPDDNEFQYNFAKKNVSRDYFGYDDRGNRVSSRSKPMKKPACDPMTEWQDTFFPTCNVLHELEIANRVLMREPSDVGKILGIGGKRIAWKISTNKVMETVVLKTIRYEKNYTLSLFENKRRDAVATERSTFSPHVMNIYGHCAGAVLNEIGEMGADEYFVTAQKKENLTTMEMLRYSRDAARAISDVHSVGVGNKTTLVHGDVRPWNFIMTEGGRRIRLHDFDQAHFLRWKGKTGEVCGFRNYACNRNRAPEECIRYTKQTEKIDVYGIGNMIFFIVAQILPYKNLGRPREENQEMVRQGITPELPKEWDKSKDPAIKLLKKVMHKCHTFDSEQRPSAEEVADELSRGYDSLLAAKEG